MAGHKGHEFMWVKNVDHQLRHVSIIVVAISTS